MKKRTTREGKKIREAISEINRILKKNPKLYDSLSPLQRGVCELIRDLDKAGGS